MSLKEKLQVVLNQKGDFRCPNGSGRKTTQSNEIAAQRYRQAVDNLKQRGESKPKTVDKLKSTLGAFFQNALTAEELDVLVESLQTDGVITIAESRITYA
jgi:cytochrome c-type biogenesis protein CcmH/NrfF